MTLINIPEKESLYLHLAARCPLNYVVSWEDEVVSRDLKKHKGKLFTDILQWSITDGMRSIDEKISQAKLPGPYEALEAICKNTTKTLYLLHDFHPYINDSRIIRKLRDAYHKLQATGSCIVIISPKLDIPLDLEKEISIFHYPLPSLKSIERIYSQIEHGVSQNKNLNINLNDAEKSSLIEAGLGLTEKELKNVFAKALVRDRTLDINDIDVILDEKRQIIEKSGYLEYYSTDDTFLNVGGLNNLKSWIALRSSVISKNAQKTGLPVPKGVLITGVPGTGKSLAAKSIASEWRWPLLRLDVGKLFGGLVGSSEENIRKTIAIAEAVAPAVLWIDEIEKGFTGVMSGGDSGASARVFSTFLTWLQEKRSSIFLVATANNISILPPEFLRKGRFDEIFFVDLPNYTEREDIIRIHLKKNKQDDLANSKLGDIVKASDGFTGAEIEQAVISSIYAGFVKKSKVTKEILLNEIESTYPLSKTMKEDIDNMRDWATYRARSASTDSQDENSSNADERWDSL